MFGSVIEAVDTALDTDVALGDTHAAIAAIEELETARRKLAALTVKLQAEVDRSGVFREDGHASAKVMVRHVAKLSNGDAAGRARHVRMAPFLPDIAAALTDGRIGVAQFDLLSRVYANPRVRSLMVDAQEWFIEQARCRSFADFETAVREWERLADMDGAAQRNQRNHDHRNVSLLQNPFDLSWELRGSFAAGQGAAIDDIFTHYVSAERLTDWDNARAEHGDNACETDLARTEPQRRADAFARMAEDAAAADDSAVPPDFCHNIVWSEHTYQAMVRVLDPADPTTLAGLDLDVDEYRCETIDGVPLEPLEAAASSLLEKFRRVIVNAASTVTDLGRARTFTGSARKAVQLSSTHCDWPGCAVPVTQCQIDHRHEHAKGGHTRPDNGGPYCGRHNRHKQKGFTNWRDPTGQWHTYRPDGTEIL